MSSTNGMTNWAVDLNDVAAIYPFQGWEVFMVIIGVIFWLGWHVMQIRNEESEVQHEMDADKSGDKARAAIDRY